MKNRPKNLVRATRLTGFTMVELLAAIAIILFLGSLVFASYQGVLRKSSLAVEIAGARQCLTAYFAYAADNDGTLIPGNPQNGSAQTKGGIPLTGAMARRYVWRLAPYVSYELHGSLLVNERKRAFPNPHDPAVLYLLSATPSFGLNSYCLGGFDEGLHQKGLVTRQGSMEGGGNLIVFASAGSVSSGILREGWHVITPPQLGGQEWTGTIGEKSPANSGAVHFRHDNKALVAHYGGHVTLKTPEEMRDMRLWNIEAIRTDDPHMAIPRN